MPELTQEQALAVQTIDKGVALIAAAGSGKTSVLVERFIYCLRQRFTPRGILVVSFTKEAADQLRQRILKRLELCPELKSVVPAVETTPNIGTLHSFCYRVLDQYGSHLGFNLIHEIIDSFEWTTTFEKTFQKWLTEITPEHLGIFFKTMSIRDLRTFCNYWFQARMALKNMPPLELPSWVQTTRSELDRFSDQLQKTFHESGKFSFDDLEELTLSILRQKEEIRSLLSSSLESICVDEFQDTSPRQWEILKLLVGTSSHKLFVVGDPKQSIYRFRGADLNVFQSAKDEIECSGGSSLELRTNFRSTAPLLDQINQLAAGLFEGFPFGYSPMLAGSVTPQSPEPLAPLKCVRFSGTRGDLLQPEIAATTSLVKNLIETGVAPSKIALLFRVTDRISDYYFALQRLGIPASAKRRSQIFNLYDCADLYAYLRALCSPSENYYFIQFLRSPYLNFKESELYELCRHSKTSLFESLKTSHSQTLGWFFNLVDAQEKNLVFALESLFKNTPYFPVQTEATLELLSALITRCTQIDEALELLQTWQRGGVSVEVSSASSRSQSVRLYTVHGAKGLEFDHVFLVDNQRLPARKYPVIRFSEDGKVGFRYRKNQEYFEDETYKNLALMEEQSSTEEARRLLYVAATRAKQQLTVLLPEDPSLIPTKSWGALWQDFFSNPQT